MKVVIVGGVAVGASCAARLRRLDEKAERPAGRRQRSRTRSASMRFAGPPVAEADPGGLAGSGRYFSRPADVFSR